MTVAELMKKLETLPQDAMIAFYNMDDCTSYEAEEVYPEYSILMGFDEDENPIFEKGFVIL